MQPTRNKQATGLDVGQKSVKAIVLKNNGGKRIQLVSAEIFHMDREGLLEEELYTQNGLPKWLRERKIPLQNLTCAIPQEICTTQVTDFPASARGDNLEQMVSYEISQLSGLSEEAFLSDYCQLPPVEGHENPTLIGICRQQIIEEFQERYSSCSVPPQDFAMAGVAAASAFLHCKGDEARKATLQLLLECGAEHTTAICIHGGCLLSIGSLLFGASQFTDALARHLGVPEKEAEERKATWRPDWSQESCPWQKPLHILLRELDAVLAHWRETEGSSLKDAPLATLWLTGAGAKTNGLADKLAEHLGCAVKIFGPSVVQDGKMVLSAPEYTVAYGLALQGLGESPLALSIAPPELKWRRRKLARIPSLAAAMLIFFAVLIASMVLLDCTISRKQAALELEMEKLERCSVLVPELEQTRDRIAYQQKLLLPIVELGSRGKNFLDAIREIGKALGKDDWCIYLADEFTVQEALQKNAAAETPAARRQSRAPRGIFEENHEDSAADNPSGFQDIATMPLLSQMVVTGFTTLSSNKRFEAILELQNKLNACGLYQNVDWHVEQDGKDPAYLSQWKSYLRKNAGFFTGRYSEFTLALPLKQKNVVLPPPVVVKKKKKK